MYIYLHRVTISILFAAEYILPRLFILSAKQQAHILPICHQDRIFAMALLQASVTLFAHVIGALLVGSGIWGMTDASASTIYPRGTPSPSCKMDLFLCFPVNILMITKPGTDVDKLPVAPHFGIPDATGEMPFMWPAAAGRNIAAGIAVLALTFQGRPQRKALGILIMCWSFAGVADLSILVRRDGSQNKAFTLGLVGWLLFTGAGLVGT